MSELADGSELESDALTGVQVRTLPGTPFLLEEAVVWPTPTSSVNARHVGSNPTSDTIFHSNMISVFNGSYRWLSNFHLCNIFDVYGQCWPSAENLYQALKCAHLDDRSRFVGLTPGQAKRLGRDVELRKDWDDIKLAVMLDVVTSKFVQNADLAQLLVATGDKHIEEGNRWGDCFWGVCNGVGENHLGKIIMQVRSKLATS